MSNCCAMEKKTFDISMIILYLAALVYELLKRLTVNHRVVQDQ